MRGRLDACPPYPCSVAPRVRACVTFFRRCVAGRVFPSILAGTRGKWAAVGCSTLHAPRISSRFAGIIALFFRFTFRALRIPQNLPPIAYAMPRNSRATARRDWLRDGGPRARTRASPLTRKRGPPAADLVRLSPVRPMVPGADRPRGRDAREAGARRTPAAGNGGRRVKPAAGITRKMLFDNW